MEYMAFVFGIFGFMAYLQLSSLKGRINELERQMRLIKGTEYEAEKTALVEAARGYIGQNIRLAFREDEEDPEVLLAGMKSGTCRLEDVDDDWMLVRIEYSNVVKDKLVRLESIQSIGV